MKLEYKRLGIQLGSQCTGYVHEMHVWVERHAVLFWKEKGSAQPHREDIIGVWVYTDCQSITPRVHSHRGGGQCSQLWTQCAGCPSSAGGGGILTAGEEKQ